VDVGKGLVDGTIEVKDRRTNTRTDIPVAEVADHLLSVVRG
jgi:prolyl-tRNA synthetase